MEIAQLLGEYGFQMAMIIILGTYLKQKLEEQSSDFRSREKSLLEANTSFAKVLSETARQLADTLSHHSTLDGKMTAAEDKLDDINMKVDILDDKLDTIDTRFFKNLTGDSEEKTK